jgi:hypothetical protein
VSVATLRDVAVPPEIIFDRYIRNKRIPRYQGKANLLLIEDPATRDLLEETQRTINDVYAAQRGSTLAPGTPPTLHFDYVDSGVVNAIAFQDEGCAFVGLTLPLFDEVGQTCQLLVTSDLVSAIFRQEKPTEHQRHQLFTAFFASQLQFIACHELGHHVHGHCSDCERSPLIWEEFAEGGSASGGLVDQAGELDADGYAVHMMLHNFVAGPPRPKLLELLGRRMDDTEDIALLELLILAAGSFFFRRQQEFERDKVADLTHPPAAARMHFVMEEFASWLDIHRPSTAHLINRTRFAALMGAAASALSTITAGVPWQEQTEFLLSQLGRDYLARVAEARSKLRDVMSNRRWKTNPG